MTPERRQQIEELYSAASHQSAAEWETFLATACVGDPGLRAEVEKLLTQDEVRARMLSLAEDARAVGQLRLLCGTKTLNSARTRLRVCSGRAAWARSTGRRIRG